MQKPYTDLYWGNFKQKIFLKILVPILDAHKLIAIIELRIDTKTLSVPLEETSLPAVRAVLRHERYMEGMGYRGKAVVAHVHKVPNSTWYLIAQTDESEAYAPLRKDLQ